MSRIILTAQNVTDLNGRSPAYKHGHPRSLHHITGNNINPATGIVTNKQCCLLSALPPTSNRLREPTNLHRLPRIRLGVHSNNQPVAGLRPFDLNTKAGSIHISTRKPSNRHTTSNVRNNIKRTNRQQIGLSLRSNNTNTRLTLRAWLALVTLRAWLALVTLRAWLALVGLTLNLRGVRVPEVSGNDVTRLTSWERSWRGYLLSLRILLCQSQRSQLHPQGHLDPLRL